MAGNIAAADENKTQDQQDSAGKIERGIELWHYLATPLFGTASVMFAMMGA